MGLIVSPPVTAGPGAATVLTVQAVNTTPLAVAYAANVTLDVSQRNDFMIAPLAGNITIAISNPSAGRAGFIWVQQDGTGNRTVTFTTPGGYTLRRDESLADLVAKTTADAQTRYAYLLYVINSVNYVEFTKAKLT